MAPARPPLTGASTSAILGFVSAAAPSAEARGPAARRCIDERDIGLRKCGGNFCGDARAGGREIDEDPRFASFDDSAWADRDRAHDVGCWKTAEDDVGSRRSRGKLVPTNNPFDS